MGALDGRVTVITGAGNGIGRQHALLFASEGAKVVVNDLGGSQDGTGADAFAAQRVVEEIIAAGGEAVANYDDVGDWDGAGKVVGQALDAFGRLDVLINNAGILRDNFLHRMTVEDWDLVIRVHLRAHFCMLRHAAEHWRARSKAGEEVNAAVINTASGSGTFLPNAGQANYGAAKAGIAALTLVAAEELPRIGVRVNAIAPVARTRLTESVPGPVGMMFAKPVDADAFDPLAPENISPLVAYLATEHCTINGKLFVVQGGQIAECSNWRVLDGLSRSEPWTIGAVAAGLGTGATA
jgi:NAD(P)-dependent dehydrogenase (short-subunit alcohol dehydrogenase family)